MVWWYVMICAIRHNGLHGCLVYLKLNTLIFRSGWTDAYT